MFNKLVLVGNLTRNIELKSIGNGTMVANTAIATNRKFKSQQGEQKEEIMFVDITFFGRSAEIANQYLHKGSQILIEGRLKFDQWVDQNGGKRSKHSVIVETMQMLGSKEHREPGQEMQPSYPPQQHELQKFGTPQATNYKVNNNIPDIDIDDCPF